MARSNPLETPVKGSEINPKRLSKAQTVKFFSKKRHGSVHGKEGVIKTMTGPHAADSRDGLEIEYYWVEATIKGYGTEWISTEMYDFYIGTTAAHKDVTPEADAAVASPDAAAAGNSATEPAAVASPDAAAAEPERAPGDSATEPAAVASPDAAAAESERAPGDSATEPAAVASPAPDAAAAESERAPGVVAALVHGDKKAAAPELCFSTVGTVQDEWDFTSGKGWEPTASPSEEQPMVVSVMSKRFPKGLGCIANQVLGCGRSEKSTYGENRLNDDEDVVPGVRAYSIDGWVTNGAGGYVNHVAVAALVHFPKAMNATPRNYFLVVGVVFDEATKSWVFVNQELLMIPASVLSSKEGSMKAGSTGLIHTMLMNHRSFYNLPNVGSRADDFRVTVVHKINPNTPRSQKKKHHCSQRRVRRRRKTWTAAMPRRLRNARRRRRRLKQARSVRRPRRPRRLKHARRQPTRLKQARRRRRRLKQARSVRRPRRPRRLKQARKQPRRLKQARRRPMGRLRQRRQQTWNLMLKRKI